MKRKQLKLQIMYAINVLAAGVPGFLIVFFPEFAEKNVLWEQQDYGVIAILGSIWLSIGFLSILGIFQPYRWLPIFVIQFFYKSIWLLSFVVPAISAGEELPPATQIIIGIFFLLIIEVAMVIRAKDFANIGRKASSHSFKNLDGLKING